MSSNNGPPNPYASPPGGGGAPTVIENAERQEVVIVKPDGTTQVVGGVEERLLIDLPTGGRRLERAQLLYQTDDGRLVLNPAEHGGEVYSCGECKRLVSFASIRFCVQDQRPTCLSCAAREVNELGMNLYFCPACHKKYRWKRFFSWLFSLGNK